MEKKKEYKKWVVQCIFLTAILILILQKFSVIVDFLKNIWGIAFPLILGAVIAYILNLLMSKLEKLYFPNSEQKIVKKSRRIVCMILSILIVAGILILVIQLVVPELVRAFGLIAEMAPEYFEKLGIWILGYLETFPDIERSIQNAIENLSINWEELFRNLLGYATSGVSGIVNSTLSFVIFLVGGVINFVIALIFALYILISKEKLLTQVKKICRAYLNDKMRKKIEDICYIANDTFSSFIIGQVTEAVILGGLCAAGMLLLRFPYAAMTGAFIGVTALIPIVGAYLGAGVGAFMILTEDPMQAVLFLVFIVILQQLEGNIIYPKVVGSSIGLPGLWVLAAVTIGGGLSGILGMLLSVPVAATVYKLVRKDVNERVEKKVQQEFIQQREERIKEQQGEQEKEEREEEK